MSSKGDCWVIEKPYRTRHVPMQAPTCPAKMPDTLLLPCANCRYFSSAIFGVWFFTVKQRGWLAGCSQHIGGKHAMARVRSRAALYSMAIRLPLANLLVPVRQIAARVPRAKL